MTKEIKKNDDDEMMRGIKMIMMVLNTM